jgi:hypothetical protein
VDVIVPKAEEPTPARPVVTADDDMSAESDDHGAGDTQGRAA